MEIGERVGLMEERDYGWLARMKWKSEVAGCCIGERSLCVVVVGICTRP